jgi:membrane protein implicated in regulation of membrane protease activity
MLAQRMMWIAWPAFLVAGVIEMLVFALVDPQSLHWFGQPIALSSEAVYTLAFFAFWLLTMMSSALTTLLAMSPFELNRRELAADRRPESTAKEAKAN